MKNEATLQETTRCKSYRKYKGDKANHKIPTLARERKHAVTSRHKISCLKYNQDKENQIYKYGSKQ